jgi:hypothetical protein
MKIIMFVPLGLFGVGLSISTPFLIRMLIARGKTVVYRVQGIPWFYEFCRKGASCQCRVFQERDFPDGVASLYEESTFYVVDAGDSGTNCNPHACFAPRVIIISSPNEIQWGGSHFERRKTFPFSQSPGKLFYYPVWSLDELQQARPYMSTATGETSRHKLLSDEEVEQRYFHVGGVPYGMFASPETFANALRQQSTAIGRLTEFQIGQFALNEDSGTYFGDKGDLKSLVTGISSDKSIPLATFTDREIKVRPVSYAARKAICGRHLTAQWNKLGRSAAFGSVFEMYIWLTLVGDPIVCRSQAGAGQEIGSITIGGCKCTRKVGNIVRATQQHQTVLFRPQDSGNSSISFIYSVIEPDGNLHFHAFQSTSSHSSIEA